MKIKDGFVIEKVGNRYLAVAVGARADECNALIRMNESGAFLWQRLAEGDKSREELLALMLEEYAVDEEIAKKDIHAFIAKLAEAGLLDA